MADIAQRTEQRYLLHEGENEDDVSNDNANDNDFNKKTNSGSQTKAFTALQISAFLATAFIKEMLPTTVKGSTCGQC